MKITYGWCKTVGRQIISKKTSRKEPSEENEAVRSITHGGNRANDWKKLLGKLKFKIYGISINSWKLRHFLLIKSSEIYTYLYWRNNRNFQKIHTRARVRNAQENKKFKAKLADAKVLKDRQLWIWRCSEDDLNKVSRQIKKSTGKLSNRFAKKLRKLS